MAKKFDLNKLRDEIDKEKKSKFTIPTNLGESMGMGLTPRDEFLHGLLTSRDSGKSTPSSNLIKMVNNKVSEKTGDVKKMSINEVATSPPPTHRSSPTPIDMSFERDEQMFRDFETKRKQTLAESIEEFSGSKPKIPTSPIINYGGQKFLTSPPAGHTAPMQLNESILVENVKNVVNSYLSENLGAVFEEAIKGTIIEMYAVERIKEVLNENRDLIKTVVVETIREIQAKNKAKAQS